MAGVVSGDWLYSRAGRATQHGAGGRCAGESRAGPTPPPRLPPPARRANRLRTISQRRLSAAVGSPCAVQTVTPARAEALPNSARHHFPLSGRPKTRRPRCSPKLLGRPPRFARACARSPPAAFRDLRGPAAGPPALFRPLPGRLQARHHQLATPPSNPVSPANNLCR